jgi:glucose/arabinose dehydrogenase
MFMPRMFGRFLKIASMSLCLLGLAATSEAQLRAVPWVSGLELPVSFAQDPADSTLQYVVEQLGRVRVVKNGVLQPTPFLDLTGAVSPNGGERGLLGIAFPADYAASRRFYVNFTDRTGNTVVARFKRSPANPLVADPATYFPLIWPSGLPYIGQPFANHNGGHLAFGPDGYLYIGLGDGGSGNDPLNLAQNPTTLLGKMLRIDVSVSDLDARGYSIPPDNPFLDSVPIPALGEIWAFGLRNPWKYAFDDGPGGTGALLLGDVGQGAREEIDYEPAGAGGRNYGWRNKEGTLDNNGNVFNPVPPAYLPLTDPVFDYGRSLGATVVGGYVYRGAGLRRSFRGRYFFADFIAGRVSSLGLVIDPMTREATVAGVLDHTAELGGSEFLGAISALGRDADGELYVVGYGGTIFKIVDITPPGDVQLVFFDFNGDAFKDVLEYNRTTGEWLIRTGTSAGGFTEAHVGGWAPGWEVHPGDFNADGLDDLFLYSRQSGVWYKAINNGSPFAYFTQGWLPGFDVHVTDLSGDDKADVFVYNPVSGIWYSCISVGSGTAGFDYASGVWAPGWSLQTADFNADGRSDLFLYDATSGVYYKVINEPAQFRYRIGFWAPGWRPLASDLNGDGRADVFLYNASSGLWYRAISTGDGTEGFAYSVGQWAPNWHVRIADFDADGRSDLFLYAASGLWYKVLNTGTGFSYFAGVWGSWTIQVHDLNGDGASDLFLYDPNSGVWYEALTTTPAAFTYTLGRFR